MKKDIKNLSASVRDRLHCKARETIRPFSEVLQFYGMERFLYRLGCSPYVDKFILKGALMFSVWHVQERRTTLDIDFLARYDNQIESIEKVIRDVCAVQVIPDGLVFDPTTVAGRRIKEDADYEGVRIKFTGFLERARIPMQIDIGFGDVIFPKPKTIDYPVILDFPNPHLKGYTAESVVSEKFEAMIKLGLLNSRMKDFYDIWIMIHQFNFKGVELAEALKRTFEHRKTTLPEHRPLFADEFYDEESDRQVLWKSFLKKGDIEHATIKLSETVREIEDFLAPPLDALSKGQALSGQWKAPRTVVISLRDKQWRSDSEEEFREKYSSEF